MNRDNQFQNSSSQAERRRVLELERATTLLEQAKISEALDSQRSKSLVVGTEQAVQYPAGSGPWSPGYWANVPDEPPLGYAINEQEPVGTPAEVARSLQDLAAPTAPAPSEPQHPRSDALLRSGAAILEPNRKIRLKRFSR
jgi:hypothetical protein